MSSPAQALRYTESYRTDEDHDRLTRFREGDVEVELLCALERFCAARIVSLWTTGVANMLTRSGGNQRSPVQTSR